MSYPGITRRAWTFAALAIAALLVLPAVASAIPRDVVLARGKVWVDLNVPYSQSRYATVEGVLVPDDSAEASKGYRTDCSGFVSMALNLRYSDGRPKSLDTASLPGVMRQIDRATLAPGDVVLRPKNPAAGISGHVVIFVSWADDAHTKFVTYEEGSSRTGTYSRVADIADLYSSGFRAYRYNGIEDDFADCQTRVSGADRYATAVAASLASFPPTSPVDVDTVVVASGEVWPDALGGAALSGAVEGPLLLTGKASLPSVTAAEIRRLTPKRVFLLGGRATVTTAVESQIASLGAQVVRLGGADRFETAGNVAKTAAAEARADGRTVDQVYVATGTNFPDALAVAPIAASLTRPVLLTEPGRLTPATERAMSEIGIKKAWVLGGEVSVQPVTQQAIARKWGVQRISGPDRYAMSSAIATHGVECGMSWDTCGIASGEVFADALSGGAAQGMNGSLLLLTAQARLSPATRQTIAANAAQMAPMRVFGGMKTVTYPVRAEVADLLRIAQ